jgi:hypothetical protein
MLQTQLRSLPLNLRGRGEDKETVEDEEAHIGYICTAFNSNGHKE